MYLIDNYYISLRVTEKMHIENVITTLIVTV